MDKVKKCRVCLRILKKNNLVGCCRRKECRKVWYRVSVEYRLKVMASNREWYSKKVARDPSWIRVRKGRALEL